jgi:ABC-type multidrug transport system ATPase subunit
VVADSCNFYRTFYGGADLRNDQINEENSRMLMVKKLSFKYPERSIFSQWEHSFRPGVTWIKGRNGSGKSTLLKILSGALKPASGDIELQGVNISTEPLEYRQQLFYCGPGPIVFDHLTPFEFFGFMRHLYPNYQVEDLKQHIEGFDLNSFRDVQLKNLSSGAQRKVWLAFALAAGTKATLLDEPFNALDSSSTEYLRSALSQCSKNVSRLWIVASHQNLGEEILLAETLTIS